jgi:hypothetical protein
VWMSASLIGPACQLKSVSVLWLLQWNLVRVRVTLLYAVELGLGQRCTHWSDGTESHAFGRALMRSRHSRLHPDHRPHSTNYLRNSHSEREGRRVSWWGEPLEQHSSERPCRLATCGAGWSRACGRPQSRHDGGLESWPGAGPRLSTKTTARCA